MFCQACGSKLPETARFCSGCGTAVNEPGETLLGHGGGGHEDATLDGAGAPPGTPGSGSQRRARPSAAPAGTLSSSDPIPGGRFVPGQIVAERYRIVALAGRRGGACSALRTGTCGRACRRCRPVQRGVLMFLAAVVEQCFTRAVIDRRATATAKSRRFEQFRAAGLAEHGEADSIIRGTESAKTQSQN